MDKDNLKRILPLISCIVVVGSVLFYVLISRNPSGTSVQFSSTVSEDEQKTVQNTEPSAGIYVYICGQVKKPGVYVFAAEPRVNEVILKAGGTTKKANLLLVNQAAKVTDGEQITIPEKISNQAKGDNSKESTKIPINRATKEELMTLTGIGEGKAESILKYRQDNGTFKKIEDLMKVTGIKEGVFQKIKDDVSL